jgi:large subunit ribosomal protein L29
MARAADLALLDPDELALRLGETRKELFNLRFQLATGQLDNPARIGEVRREVARMLTVLRQREIAQTEGTFVAPTTDQQAAARAHLAMEAEEQAAARAARSEHKPGMGDDDDLDGEVTDDDAEVS